MNKVQLKQYKAFSAALKLLMLSSLLISGSAASSYSMTRSQIESVENSSNSITVAQRPNPNQDRLLPAGTEPPAPLPQPSEVAPLEDSVEDSDLPESPSAPPDPLAPSNQPPSDQPEISVTTTEVVGNTVLSPEDIARITQPLEGKVVTVAELTQAADAITQLYLDRGYITSRAVIPEQAITDGIVQIQVSEGQLSDIQIEGLSRLRPGYVRSRLQRGTTVPLNASNLEEQLRLLSVDPLLETIKGRLQPGENVGESVLSVEAEEADAWRVGASVDNYSSPSLGSERLGVSLAYQNLSGWGDTLSTSYFRSTTGGSNVWDIGYRLPVNALDGALSLRFSQDKFEVTQGAAAGLSDGDSQRYEISFRQPIIRSLKEEFALSAGFSYRDGQTFLSGQPFGFGFGPDPDTGISRTSVFKFGQDYTRRDVQGVWSVRSQFSLGTSLLDATENSGDIPDSQFFSWLGQVQRAQRLGRDNLLIVQGDLQLTPDSLLSSEQFVIGGGQSLRGYRQNARNGDNGFRLSIEDRIVLTREETEGTPIIQLAPFFDAGAVWNARNNPNQLNDQTFLAGAGLGFLYDPFDSLNVRLDYAIPLVTLDDEGDNAQDEGFYFSVNYQY